MLRSEGTFPQSPYYYPASLVFNIALYLHSESIIYSPTFRSVFFKSQHPPTIVTSILDVKWFVQGHSAS